MADGTCPVVEDGNVCGKPVKARGWCDKHWKRWKKHGDPLIAGKRGYPGTPEAEAERRRKIGDAQRGKSAGPKSEETRRKISEALTGRKLPPEQVEKARASMLAQRDKIAATSRAQWERWRAERGLDAPSYSGLHRRVRRALGSASEYECVECGGPALHWSQIHGTDGTALEHYRPMCQPCHFAYDQVGAQAKATLGPEGRRNAALKAWETKRRKKVDPAGVSPDLPLAGP